MVKKVGFVIAAADGIFSLQTGVGVVVNFFFESFNEICRQFPEYEIDLFAACPTITKESSDFDQCTLDMVAGKCLEFKGKVISLDNLSSGSSLNEIWKGTDKYSPTDIWESCCAKLAKEAEEVVDRYDQVIIIAHDTLFANLSSYIRSEKIKVCWIPHSLGTLFADPNQSERINFEKSTTNGIVARKDKIGYISNLTKQHLNLYYDISDSELAPFYSGIYFDSKRYHNRAKSDELFQGNEKTRNKKLIFSWGRCSDQKGIDVIIDAFAFLVNKMPDFASEFHLVLISPTETTYPEYWLKICDSLSKLPVHTYTFIDRFQDSLQYDILNYSQTRIVVLCSRYESFGITSIETIYKAHPGVKIIYSPIPTFQEIFEKTPNAFPLDEINSSCLSAKIQDVVMDMVDVPKELLGSSDVRSRFDFVENYSRGIGELINAGKPI